MTQQPFPQDQRGTFPLMTRQRDNCNWYRREGSMISANTVVCTKVCMAGVKSPFLVQQAIWHTSVRQLGDFLTFVEWAELVT